eukprot:TRINITY_DN13213_c0_g1_i1.p1 TRINITY_DN13213_c0_g1~~TRINITY_DN13213_c0_g1_i1.p1  ORF type:complete len:97 (+),score=17.63 TRINITY_DN13213_c0_g1_i1:39-293(+)
MEEANSLGTGSSADKIGKEALRLTNEFRKKNHLPELMWQQALANIGQKHSKNMSEKKYHLDTKDSISAFKIIHFIRIPLLKMLR